MRLAECLGNSHPAVCTSCYYHDWHWHCYGRYYCCWDRECEAKREGERGDCRAQQSQIAGEHACQVAELSCDPTGTMASERDCKQRRDAARRASLCSLLT